MKVRYGAKKTMALHRRSFCIGLVEALFISHVLWTMPTLVHCFVPSSKRVLSHRLVGHNLAQIFTADDSAKEEDSNLVSIDPLLTNALFEASSSSLDVGGVVSASTGIRAWRVSLEKGRTAVEFDFSDGEVWPREPLFSALSKAMTIMQLPRFVRRHPETVSAVLLSMLRLIISFNRDARFQEGVVTDDTDGDFYFSTAVTPSFPQTSEDINQLAEEITANLVEEWNGIVSGVNILDQLFGDGHGLLNVQDQNGEGAAAGFGLHDGIWKHTGWCQIPELQKQISSMPELRDLLKDLGRRPTAENSDKLNKFSPRKHYKDGGMGAEFDPQMRESVSGITLSGNLSEMLPSEAVFLRGSFPVLRRLFMAKRVESKLLSYQMSGWTDVPSVPITRPLYLRRLPSAPGGPIIVCLDTSWSMSGKREALSKAVVLACVSAAHKQGRDCQVVAFSTERGTMEAGVITADAGGVKRLLNFLSHSFGGGTDVTGALKFAMRSLESEIMSEADILLVTDGEIPNPPVSDELLEALDRLKLQRGVEMHGLLVGKNESKPLSRICTKTHNFLVGYDTMAMFESSRQNSPTALMSTTTAGGRLSTWHVNRLGFTSCQRRKSFTLFARRSVYDDYEGRPRHQRKQKRKNSRREEYEYEDGWKGQVGVDEDYVDIAETEHGALVSGNAFVDAVDQATTSLQLAAEERFNSEVGIIEELEKERDADESCWEYQSDLRAAIERICEGLVERNEESSLVVLAMIAKEHILLLGVPGTGKSVLGRRLSKLCNGSFFQRLLTRFTTPEELFGPLSLRSLENDEYRRSTSGFLPTASVAFLDEIFKANSAILNTLLTILNERKFDNAGGQELCPIRCVVGASNELPESDELVALFDRFLIRKEVQPVSNEGLIEMLSMDNPGYSACDSNDTETSCNLIFANGLDEVVGAFSAAVSSIHMGVDACELMRDLRTYMREEHNIDVSDRRLVKVARLMKISAASHGRARVDPIDCVLLQHCIWQLPEQRNIVRDWLWDNLTPEDNESIHKFRVLLESLRHEILIVVRRTSGDVAGENGAREDDVRILQSLLAETSRIVAILQKREHNLARHIQLLRHSDEFLWIEPNESQAMTQVLLPRAEAVAIELKKICRDALSLELSISNSEFAPTNELRLSVIEQLWEEGYSSEVAFTDDELNMGMREAKAKYDLETFRKWKRARKKSQKDVRV